MTETSSDSYSSRAQSQREVCFSQAPNPFPVAGSSQPLSHSSLKVTSLNPWELQLNLFFILVFWSGESVTGTSNLWGLPQGSCFFCPQPTSTIFRNTELQEKSWYRTTSWNAPQHVYTNDKRTLSIKDRKHKDWTCVLCQVLCRALCVHDLRLSSYYYCDQVLLWMETRGLVSKKEQESSSPKTKLSRDFIWAQRGGKTMAGEKSLEYEPS